MRAAAVQLNSTADRDRNLEAADRLTRAAAAAGADLVVLPEKWAVLASPEETAAGAEPLDGPALTWARDAARELGIDLVAGSIAERVEGADRGRNTSVHFGPDGEARATYRKIHMFDVEVGGTSYRESDTDEPGDEVVVSSTADGVELGLSICYDLRFPELYRELAAPRRARRSPSPPPSRSRPRASTGRCSCAPARSRTRPSSSPPTRSGSTRRAIRSGGRSMIVDPWGLVLAQAPDTETFAIAELDLERQREIRRTLPSLANRRIGTEAHA